MLSGTADPEAMAASAPYVAAPATEPLVCHGAELLQLVYQIDAHARQEVLPPALHPVNPPVITVSVLRAAESDAGPFTLAETRVVCRSGARGRGFHVSGFIDGEEAARLLARRWGYRTRPAAVELRLRHHGATAEVREAGRPLLDARLLDPVPLAPADLQFTDSMHLARTPRGNRLIQVERAYDITAARRGRPVLAAFEAAGWGEPRLRPSHPISAVALTGDVVFRPVRYLCRADVSASEGTERIDHA
ncbi:acetoacetate decarboxylase family protein [Streptomyces sp. CSDS2]|uniref:acetoacetate decarboxylase family protein n=1 Tax=Streptomyces sp. CSDS2 TaxID=3055051 RepID=UPI0025B0F3C8|nr:acetoacetate decarboxylase family protein [Streptomyces sp. CSDS2]MDN3258833.1 acetoacetate decarboxylase family protein [Streptomyces sp. CSDS2]